MRSTKGASWQIAAQRLQNESVIIFLALVLSVCLAVLGCGTKQAWVLTVSKMVAIVVVLLEFSTAFAGTLFVLKAKHYIKRHWARVRDPNVKQLRDEANDAATIAFGSWFLAFMAIGLPFVTDVLMKVPAVGMIYPFMMFIFGSQLISTAVYRSLAAAVDECQRMPRVSVAAM